MTHIQQNRLRKALLTKREELIQQLERRREGLILMPASDPVDRVRNIVDRDLNVRYSDRIYQTLGAVEAALKQIDAGNYGVCAQCGEDIPMRRLEVIPWSPHCVPCQEFVELAAQSEDREGAYAVAS